VPKGPKLSVDRPDGNVNTAGTTSLREASPLSDFLDNRCWLAACSWIATMPGMPTSEIHQRAHVASLWRYPVKSMRGESCEELRFEERGVIGDRAFGVLDLASRTIVSAKRDGRLLYAVAATSSGELVVTLPGGQELDQGEVLDENLSRWLERPVKLIDAATYECQEDFERDDSALVEWEGSSGSFVDESPLHLLTTTDLELLARERPELQWSVRRFRPNVVIDTSLESLGSLESGQRLRLGGVEIEIQKGCTRCVMTTRPQPELLDRQLDILRHVIKEHDNVVGSRAVVVKTGLVRVGDQVSILP